MKTTRIDIGESFSKTPFGRYATDGEYSGEAFRKNFLVPALKKYDSVEVDLNNVQNGYEYSSSFLHEAFGGLVIIEGFSSEEVNRKLNILYVYEDVLEEINDYIASPDQYL